MQYVATPFRLAELQGWALPGSTTRGQHNHFARAHGALVLRTSRRQDMAYYPAELQSPTPCRSKLLPATVPPAPLQRRPAHSCDGVPPASLTGQTLYRPARLTTLPLLGPAPSHMP